MRRWIRFIIGIGLIFILLYLFSALYEDWIWFKDLGYEQLFWIPLTSKFFFQAINGTILFMFIAAALLSIRHAILTFMNERLRKRLRVVEEFEGSVLSLSRKQVTISILVISALVSYSASFISGFSGWLEALMFFKPTTFGITDPVYSNDLSFYFFRLPFLETVFNAFFTPLSLLTFLTIVFYIITGVLHFHSWKIWRKGAIQVAKEARRHLAALIGILFAFRTFGYFIERYQLLYSQHGHVVGAGYTDLHANLPVLIILIVLSALSIVLAGIAFWRDDVRLLSIPFVGNIVFAMVFYGAYPALLQSLVVEPNEFNKEAAYIQQEIAFTRYGYGLNNIKEEDYPGTAPLTGSALQSELDTLNNIRLNDVKPMLNTYTQKQGIRLYYQFHDIDIDRYTIEGQYRQVMLSPRELSAEELESKAKTFVNLRFKYTHGYGAAASFASAVTSEGLPKFALKDIPPSTTFSELELIEPRIYFGELTNDWVVANTIIKEFDYPQGTENAENSYKGTTGIQLTPLNKFMVSVHQMTARFYLSREITDQSKLLLHRNIIDRVNKLAPFLSYDDDPYLVIDNGRLKWIIDAYTTSNALPYSNAYPNEGLNYIRNSVKVVVDAYNGNVDFYAMDQTDPVLQTYEKIFPGMFKDGKQISANLKSHLRYPETLFNMQSNILKNFHVSNPAVFYNKEDAWDIGKELLESKAQYVEPYYTIMKLPGESKAEFVLMIPFTPASSTTNTRNNMVAWMAARMDGEHYGELVLYKLPKNTEIDGPLQVESKIDQDPEISRQLALWNQKGSSVIRGDLFVLPIQGSFLYVEPIYLQSDKSGSIPEMKRIVLGYQDKLVMASTLNEGLSALFGSSAPQLTSSEDTSQANNPSENSEQDGGADRETIESMQEKIDQLKATLDELENQLKELTPNK